MQILGAHNLNIVFKKYFIGLLHTSSFDIPPYLINKKLGKLDRWSNSYKNITICFVVRAIVLVATKKASEESVNFVTDFNCDVIY